MKIRMNRDGTAWEWRSGGTFSIGTNQRGSEEAARDRGEYGMKPECEVCGDTAKTSALRPTDVDDNYQMSLCYSCWRTEYRRWWKEKYPNGQCPLDVDLRTPTA